MMPSLHDKESHQSPWCVTWPGPCHHRAPVVAEKYPPLPLPHPHLLSLIAREGVQRWGAVRQTESRQSRQRPCEYVSYGTDLVLMTPTHAPTHQLHPSATHTHILCAHLLPPIPPTPSFHSSILASIIPSRAKWVCSSTSVPWLHPFKHSCALLTHCLPPFLLVIP